MKSKLNIESLEELAFSYIAEAKHHYDQIQHLKSGIGTSLVKDSKEKREREILECMMNHFAVAKYIEDVVGQEIGEEGGESDGLH